ncbi:unnamed protein product [Rotaria socialis]|uniref:Uncharacterized protein n=1 Tax=Rotaria socialis TaxID=392032 RepID=A0A817TM86_9BILA|nr:unnamed protein product [Rotaria socialis]CAF3175354.1 unnamed protein product [Rotaria socialis]CAF3311243.1 unnamed protein product [Rotaria socialis]CAF3318071.1 unnamed protein product [Rotaria socialis]CAF3439794.1 unnamed protein product [Rotaria socialis]
MTAGEMASLFSSDRLLGLEEIESGFDVTNMASRAQSESRFRIFDLSETGSNKFKVSVQGRERIFNTPLSVQVNGINRRRDMNCEDLSSDYTHFYSNYFRSTRSTSTWSAFIVGGSTSRHDTLRKIEEAINKQSKTVATSTSWLGLYSIQLGPSFLLKSWIGSAVLAPVVVNRTLAPLSNLFFEYPDIQAHLERTANHYLNHGKYPMIAELNG